MPPEQPVVSLKMLRGERLSLIIYKHILKASYIWRISVLCRVKGSQLIVHKNSLAFKYEHTLKKQDKIPENRIRQLQGKHEENIFLLESCGLESGLPQGRGAEKGKRGVELENRDFH